MSVQIRDAADAGSKGFSNQLASKRFFLTSRRSLRGLGGWGWEQLATAFLQGVENRRIEACPGGFVVMLVQRNPHPGFPKTPDMARNAFDTRHWIRIGFEEASDRVRHLD
jgi:hypothetical protein